MRGKGSVSEASPIVIQALGLPGLPGIGLALGGHTMHRMALRKLKEQDMLTPEELAQLRSMIDERHMALEAELHSDAARARAETYGELAGPVADPGDSASATLISDISNAELRRDLQELRALEAARDRIEDGTYGFCVDCGQDIGFKRLLAQPTALRCLPHQQAYEKTHAQSPRPTL